MGKLINEWVTESILTEDIKKTVVTYVGRFHPFHSGHNATYQHLVKKFGKDNVYIGTSDKVQLPKSPFTFKEKVQIMTTMFGIPKNKIVKRSSTSKLQTLSAQKAINSSSEAITK